MKAVQILTDESIEKIEKTIEVMEGYKRMYPFNALLSDLSNSIDDLKAIIADVQED